VPEFGNLNADSEQLVRRTSSWDVLWTLLSAAILVESALRVSSRLRGGGTDIGLFLMQGARIAYGQKPYSEFFMLQFPGFAWLYALIFYASPWNPMFVDVLLFGGFFACGWIIHRMVSRECGTGAALLCIALVSLSSAIEISQPYRLFAYAALLASAHVERGSTLIVGVCCGIAALFDQALGGVALIVNGIAIFFRGAGNNQTIRLFIGAAIPLGMMVTILAVQGAIGDWFYCTIWFPLTRYRAPNAFHGSIFEMGPRSLMKQIPASAIGLVCLRDLFSRESPRTGRAAIALGALIAGLVKENQLGLDGWTLPVLMYAFAWLGKYLNRLRLMVALGFSLTFWLLVALSEPHRAPAPSVVEKWASDHADVKLAFFVWRPEAYFSARQVPPLYLDSVESLGFHPPEMLKRLIAQLEAYRPDTIVWDNRTGAWEPGVPPEKTTLSPLYRWIKQHYQKQGDLGPDTEVYVLR
jgi:hypothetical protein